MTLLVTGILLTLGALIAHYQGVGIVGISLLGGSGGALIILSLCLLFLGKKLVRTTPKGLSSLHESIAKNQTLDGAVFTTVDQNKVDEQGLAPLHYAAMFNHTQAIERLTGCDVDLVAGEGTTSLMLAAQAGHEETISALLKRKANVHYKHPTTGWTPLHVAAGYGKQKVFDLLVQAGAQSNIVDNNGKTPEALMSEYSTNHVLA